MGARSHPLAGPLDNGGSEPTTPSGGCVGHQRGGTRAPMPGCGTDFHQQKQTLTSKQSRIKQSLNKRPTSRTPPGAGSCHQEMGGVGTGVCSCCCFFALWGNRSGGFRATPNKQKKNRQINRQNRKIGQNTGSSRAKNDNSLGFVAVLLLLVFLQHQCQNQEFRSVRK